MTQKYCKYLNNGLNIHHFGLKYCNKIWFDRASWGYDKKSLEEFWKTREEVFKKLKNGIAPENCEKCMYLQEIDDNEIISDKIKFIEIYNWIQCNCACFYCSNREQTKLKIFNRRNQKGVIDALPLLKNLQKKGKLDADLEVFMAGGEPTILKEFVGLLKFFIKNNYRAHVLSNGILYEKYISKLINTQNHSSLSISLDCGTRETFKKIKGVDKFDDVIKNIKKYVTDTKELSDRIMLKYILLKGVNDNKEEIDKWIDVCSSIGVVSYVPSIEFCHSVMNPEKSELTPEICDLYEYIKKRVKEVNPDFNVYTYDFVEEIIKRNSYNIR